MFFGGKGYMVVEDSGFKTFFGDKREPGEAMKMAEPAQDEDMRQSLISWRLGAPGGGRTSSRKSKRLLLSADLIHMANIGYRTGRKLVLESGSTRFMEDGEASRLLTRHPYRAPYVVS